MDIKIKATDFEMTPEVNAYIEDKIGTLSRLLTEEESTAHYYVEVGRNAGHPHQGNVWKAEIAIQQAGERFHVIGIGESVNAAIDLAKDEMLQQLRKSKRRHETLTRRLGGRLKKFTRFGKN